MNPKVSVIINENQTQVPDTTVFPYSAIGQFKLVFKTSSSYMTAWGTGTLIKSNIVLTAAHNMYNAKEREFINLENSSFAPAINGGDFEDDGYEIKQYWIPADYQRIVNEKGENDPEAVRLDYALVELTNPVPADNGVCAMADPYQDPHAGQLSISIAGYPVNEESTMWVAKGTVAFDPGHPQDVIRYRIDASAGQSGSALLTDSNQIAAIHSGGNNSGATKDLWYNEGVVLRTATIRIIEAKVLEWENEEGK
ncbi:MULTISPECIES: trypsin-like serine peptidase [Paenibacillus]|uniref:trypsin-like serine peptidase n=1 Tax=Paenibacillus TaxID=44249 RepID=UPI0022B8C8CB|nr:trypsin-like peptidase domain-containing protein [Paenibacillus caseinilyticus]MCZ8521756.1 trypsin-like peptidase domain-containing protein [Paenibacillus caseinilyticus]